MAAGRRAEDGGAPPLALQWAQRGSAGLGEARLVLKAFVDTSSGERRDHKPSQGVAWRGQARPGASWRGSAWPRAAWLRGGGAARHQPQRQPQHQRQPMGNAQRAAGLGGLLEGFGQDPRAARGLAGPGLSGPAGPAGAAHGKARGPLKLRTTRAPAQKRDVLSLFPKRIFAVRRFRIFLK